MHISSILSKNGFKASFCCRKWNSCHLWDLKYTTLDFQQNHLFLFSMIKIYIIYRPSSLFSIFNYYLEKMLDFVPVYMYVCRSLIYGATLIISIKVLKISNWYCVVEKFIIFGNMIIFMGIWSGISSSRIALILTKMFYKSKWSYWRVSGFILVNVYQNLRFLVLYLQIPFTFWRRTKSGFFW